MAENLVPAFEVIDPKSGHRWMIYPDGQVRGFGECIIINRIPLIEARAAQAAIARSSGRPDDLRKGI